MSMSESFEALRRANPRHEAGFEETVAAARARVATAEPRRARSASRGRLVALAVVALAVAAATALSLTMGSHGENAAAAVRKAATLSAASAEQSGTAIVRIRHDGDPWADRTIRWHGADLAIVGQDPGRGRKAGSQLLLVHGLMYGIEDGAWVELGPPESIDPGSGTTPAEYLAAVREDVGGKTLRRITSAVTGLTTRRLADGSDVYRGSVPAAVIARETSLKGGQQIRVLPFGYVANGEAADPASPLDVAVTVGAEGIVREIAVSWGTWTYTVAYSGLGATPAPAAPAHARSLLKERLDAAAGRRPARRREPRAPRRG